MTAREFCYWLQGYFEIVEANPGPMNGFTPPQAAMIKRHLAMVFHHEIDKTYPDGDKLNDLHSSVTSNLENVQVRC